MLYEISRRFIHLNKHEDPSLYWYNSVICVQANKHLTFFDFSYNLHSLEKKIDLKENAIDYPSNSPISTQFLHNFVQKGIKNVELMEMVTNPPFWPHSKILKKEMENIKSFKCSPNNFINNCQNVVAVVNNYGNVNFLAPSRGAYTNHLDFTADIKNHINVPECLELLIDINKIKEFVYKLCTSAICWAPETNNDNSCYFVTVQKSGDILFWCIRCDLASIKSEFCGNIKSNFTTEIDTVTWIPLAHNRMLLIMSNNLGQLITHDLSVENNQFKLIKEDYIWDYKDRMVAKFIEYHKYDDKLMLIYNKNRHIIIQLLDEKLNILSQNILPINDQKIISVVKFKDYFYLGTMNTKLYKLNVIVESNEIEPILESIEIKENFNTYELFGVGISQNGALMALGLKDKRLLHRKEALKIDIVFFSMHNTPNIELYNIINNPSQKFSDIWDYIELFRCKVVRNKTVPEFDYDNLYLESNTSVYKMKVYFIILTFYLGLRKSKPVILPKLPNTSEDEIREGILIIQAVNLFNNLILEYQKDKKFNCFKTECFAGAKNFITYYCNKYKKSIGELIEKEKLDMCSSNSESFICQSCESTLEGFACTNNVDHFNMYCSLTFTPNESSNYLICKGCGVTAREELIDDKPTCLFCDIPFMRYDIII